MKFASVSLISAILYSTAVYGWVVAFYNGGDSCGDTATNYVSYEGTDSDCHVIGSADDSCKGFTDGGSTSDNSLCGATFSPTSGSLNSALLPPSGSCGLYYATDCPAGTGTSISGGCSSIPANYVSFKCT